MNPMDLKRGIDKAVSAVVDEMKKRTKKITTPAETAQVDAIAANSEVEIGKMISEAMQKVGNEGVITVEEAKGIQTELEVVEGMQFDRGYVSPYFITNAEKMVAELAEPYILIHEKKLSRLSRLLPLLRAVVQVGQAVADHRRGRRGRGARHAGGEQASRRPEGRGGEGARLRRSPQGDARGHRDPHRRHVISEDLGVKLENVKLNELGKAKRVLHREGEHHDRRRRRQEERHHRPLQPDQAQIEETTSTTTARSCRSDWPSWRAASR